MEVKHPRMVLCVLCNWLDFGEITRAVTQLGGQGFELDTEYSQLHPDSRMTKSFQACADRVTPSMTEEDWQNVSNHTAVAYIVSPELRPEFAQTIAAQMLNLLAAIFEKGALAAKCENSGIAHGKAKWLQLAAQYAQAERASDIQSKCRTLYYAWVRRPIASAVCFYSCGMQLLGLPDVELATTDVQGLKSIEIIDSAALALLTHQQEQWTTDNLQWQTTSLECQRYARDELFYNQYGYISVRGKDSPPLKKSEPSRHKIFSDQRLALFNNLFNNEPVSMFPHNSFSQSDSDILIDVYVYEVQVGDTSAFALLTNGMSDERLTDPRMPGESVRTELIQYVAKPTEGHAQLLHSMAWLPRFDGFLLDSGNTIAWPLAASEGTPWSNGFFLYPPFPDHRDLDWQVDGEPCKFLWFLPISDAELEYKKKHKLDAFIELMDQEKLPFIFDERRRHSLVKETETKRSNSLFSI